MRSDVSAQHHQHHCPLHGSCDPLPPSILERYCEILAASSGRTSKPMNNPPQPVLIIYSHGRNPPLHPPPDLKYDLRNIPNPPKALRQVSDGRSKRLREHLLSEPRFIQRLEAVEQDILGAMESRLAEHAASAKEPGLELENTESEDPEIDNSEVERDKDTCNARDNNETAKHAADASVGNEEPDPLSAEKEVVLRVGCNCALGHHRSVAFVEELSRRAWPKEWAVHVVHRDIVKKRAGGTRRMQKATFRESIQEAYE